MPWHTRAMPWGLRVPPRAKAAEWYFGAADLAMTPGDLARWDIAFLEHKVLSARVL